MNWVLGVLFSMNAYCFLQVCFIEPKFKREVVPIFWGLLFNFVLISIAIIIKLSHAE